MPILITTVVCCSDVRTCNTGHTTAPFLENIYWTGSSHHPPHSAPYTVFIDTPLPSPPHAHTFNAKQNCVMPGPILPVVCASMYNWCLCSPHTRLPRWDPWQREGRGGRGRGEEAGEGEGRLGAYNSDTYVQPTIADDTETLHFKHQPIYSSLNTYCSCIVSCSGLDALPTCTHVHAQHTHTHTHTPRAHAYSAPTPLLTAPQCRSHPAPVSLSPASIWYCSACGEQS